MKTELIIRNDILTVMIGEHITDMSSSVLCIYDFDWNRYLSPWKHEKVFAQGEAFAGEADAFLEEVLKLIPERNWKEIIIAGYSLAGLFALYACTKSEVFTGCMCASGSLWFDGFVQYLKDNPVHCGKVYLSLGDKEKNTKNPVMSKVEINSLKAVHEMEKYTSVYFEMNPGGHFNDPDGRVMKGIRHMLSD